MHIVLWNTQPREWHQTRRKCCQERECWRERVSSEEVLTLGDEFLSVAPRFDWRGSESCPNLRIPLRQIKKYLCRTYVEWLSNYAFYTSRSMRQTHSRMTSPSNSVDMVGATSCSVRYSGIGLTGPAGSNRRSSNAVTSTTFSPNLHSCMCTNAAQ